MVPAMDHWCAVHTSCVWLSAYGLFVILALVLSCSGDPDLEVFLHLGHG